jgi:hypothetical protein
LCHSAKLDETETQRGEVSSINIDPLFLLQSITDGTKEWAELVDMGWHRLNGDDGIVFVLSSWLTT